MIVAYAKASKLLSEFASKKIVLVGGCFDVFHYGHLQFLKNAREQGEILVVALEPDEFIRAKKKRSRIHTQVQRAEILSHLDMVDMVILLPHFSSYEEYLELVTLVKPSVIAITEGDPFKAEKQKQADEVGATLQVVSKRITTHSTASILNYASISSN
jgi:FAD synthetase